MEDKQIAIVANNIKKLSPHDKNIIEKNYNNFKGNRHTNLPGMVDEPFYSHPLRFVKARDSMKWLFRYTKSLSLNGKWGDLCDWSDLQPEVVANPPPPCDHEPTKPVSTECWKCRRQQTFG